MAIATPRDWEGTLKSWGKPPGDAQRQKCEHAETAIRNAVAAANPLRERNTVVFPQGSYRNRTNVRIESDVDICILCKDTFYYKLPEGAVPSDFDIIPGTYFYTEYKNAVESALRAYFGSQHVSRESSKAFDVHENSYRVDADAIACFEYRCYHEDGRYLSGTCFFPDGQSNYTVNWPDQNYQNGVARNDETGRRFKSMVRCLKCLRNEMLDKGYAEPEPIASYLIECLVWNAPKEAFGHDSCMADIRYVLADLFNHTRTDEDCRDWGEINELKYLFRTVQPWTRVQVNSFLDAAWDYIGFE
jgi:hypothetical protein